MAKTRARKSHRPVTPILQLVGAIWSVKDKKKPTTEYQTQPTGLNYVEFKWFLLATAVISC